MISESKLLQFMNEKVFTHRVSLKKLKKRSKKVLKRKTSCLNNKSEVKNSSDNSETYICNLESTSLK